MLVGNPSTPLGDLPGDVHFGDKWAHERVVSGFQHALGAVLPSVWPDPCPTTVLEAMALGTPVVTTPMGGIADMVTHDESALVVTPGDVDETEAALRRIIAEPSCGPGSGRGGEGACAAVPAERGGRHVHRDLRGARPWLRPDRASASSGRGPGS